MNKIELTNTLAIESIMSKIEKEIINKRIDGKNALEYNKEVYVFNKEGYDDITIDLKNELLIMKEENLEVFVNLKEYPGFILLMEETIEADNLLKNSKVSIFSFMYEEYVKANK